MPYWTITLTIAAFAVPLAERFYTRFYPEPETQKRHLKTAARWSIDCTCVGLQFWSLLLISHQPMPTTTKGVIFIAIIASLAIVLPFFLVGMRLSSHFMGRLLDLQGRQLDSTSRIINVLEDHEKAIQHISASALAPNAQEGLARIPTLDALD